MDGLGKKIGYLKGLMEGIDFSDNPSGEKLFTAMMDLVSELGERVIAMEEMLDDLNDYVESIDDDLSLLEGEHGGSLRFSEDEDEEEYLDDLGEGEDQLHLLGGAEPEDDIQTLAGAICPACRRMFFVSVDDPEGAAYTCPHCGDKVNPEPLTPENAPIASPAED